LSIGSDIAGSLRTPAHFCGIYAHEPTLGAGGEPRHRPADSADIRPSRIQAAKAAAVSFVEGLTPGIPSVRPTRG
jgi:hypothetical protein